MAKRPFIDKSEIKLAHGELDRHVQRGLDETNRDLAWIRTSFVAVLFGVLAVVNFVTLTDEARFMATAFALAVAIAFAGITAINRFVPYRASLANAVMFFDLCILQLDFVAFSIVTDGLMSGFGVYIMTMTAGIFMTSMRWLLATIVVLVVSWQATLWYRGVGLDPSDIMMLVSSVFMAFFFLTMRIRSARRLGEHELMEQKYKESLEYAIDHIETLSGLLPICASCKSIRTAGNEWTSIEAYVAERSDVEFTHSVCPTCHKDLYPELNS